MRKIELSDCRRHTPENITDTSWQESFYLGWVDARRRICGAHHISLAPGGADTHVWSWTMVEGRVVGRSQEHGMALPDGDYDDLTVGKLRVRIMENTRDIDLVAKFDGAAANLAFRGHCDPVEMGINFGDMVLGERHYENMGFVTGTLTLEGRDIPIEASAWTDHSSWGARDFSTNISHRWLWASFGADLSISVFGFVTGSGIYFSGWVLDRGEVYPVVHAEFNAIVGDDGATPKGCDAVVRTIGNRTYRVRGRSDEAALMGGIGWFAMNGLTHFECGGRIGEGYLEFNNLKKLTPAMKDELNL